MNMLEIRLGTGLLVMVMLAAPIFGMGCGGMVTSEVEVIPPQAVPQPEAVVESSSAAEPSSAANQDPDEDGVLGAADRCPDKAETKNGFEDDDGCPDEVPAAHLDGNAMVLKEPLTFQSSGALAASSNAVMDAIAEVLKKEAAIETLEIGAHMKQGGNAGLDGLASKARASAVARALEQRGVDSGRLSAKGHGAKCGHASDSVRLVVTRRGGQSTNVNAGCVPQ
jgi:outer membrane protein OmpA-like peptidoglycan-associated protein